MHVLVAGIATLDSEPILARSLIRAFVDDGWEVTVVDDDRPTLAGLEAELRASDSPARVVRAPRTDTAALTDAIRSSSASPAPTALVNLPQRLPSPSTLESTPPLADLGRRLHAEILGYLHAVRSVLPGMLEQGSGVIVNLTALPDHHPSLGSTADVVTTSAVLSMTSSLAAEYGRRGIHVQGFSLGLLEPETWEEPSSPWQRYVLEHSVVERPAAAAEIADVIRDTIARPTSLLAGHTVTLDGGLSPFGVREA